MLVFFILLKGKPLLISIIQLIGYMFPISSQVSNLFIVLITIYMFLQSLLNTLGVLNVIR